MAFNDPELTTSDIKAVADLASDDLSLFISNAVAYVTEVLGDSLLSDFILRQIAINIAAHFAFLKEGQIKSETIGPTANTFNITTGLGLNATTFGQQAIFLDSTKTLAKLNDANRKSIKASFTVI